MKDRLFQLLGIESGEESMVSMLLTQSVFLGIFLGAFDISAHSLFLTVFDEKMMARGYVISGLAGIILTATYTWLQAKVPFRTFAVSNLAFVTVFTFLLWVALLMAPGKLITFAVFVMLGPLNILAMLGFWGTTGRLFTLRQGKRLFGLVDVGLVIGSIISYFVIPILLSLNFSSHNILLISTASIFSATLIQGMIGRKFTFVVVETNTSEKKPGLTVFRDNSYIRMMGIFVALSVMTAFFVQYSFMAVTRQQYPLEEDMARFLGLFTGSMMIFTLLVKLLVFSYIIKNYGLRLCLALSPILVIAFTALAVIIGLTMGYTPLHMSGFIIFFLILALSRLFSKSLKDSIESPSFKVIYQTVDEKIRYEVQSGIDGTVNEISALSSGLILAGLGALTFVKLIHFSIVLFVIISAWIYVAFRLYSEYRKTIRNSLEAVESGSQVSGENGWDTLRGPAAGRMLFSDNYYRMAIGDLTPIDLTRNISFLNIVADHSEIHQDPSLLPALKKIASSATLDEAVRHRATEIIDQISVSNGDPRKSDSRKKAALDDEKIINARKTLSENRQPQTTEILRLLRDNSLESKRLGIFLIGKFRLDDMISEVCDCLRVKGLETDASRVLESFGQKAYQPLFRTFLSTSGNTNISKAIIHLLGKSSDRDSEEFLFARLWANSRTLKETAAELLVKCGYKADGEDKDKLHQLVTEIIGLLTWNISAQACLAKSENTLLREVMDRETASWNSFLFNILAIAYDRNSLNKILVNLENGTVGSVNYALEMIDLVIDDSIKPRLVMAVDVVSFDEKLKNLHQFYPGEIPQYERLIDDILNRDYNLISIWAKACALHTCERIAESEMAESVTALLFSPEEILREEAARLIARGDKAIFDDVKSRIPAQNLYLVESIIDGKYSQGDYLFEKTMLLTSFFLNIPEDELLSLAGYVKKADGETDHGSTDQFIFWSETESEVHPLILTGDEISGKTSSSSGDHSGYLLNLNMLEEFSRLYPEHSLGVYRLVEMSESKA